MFVLFISCTVAGCNTSNLPQTTASNEKPLAYIESITPENAEVGEVIVFNGYGYSESGEIIKYQWRSSFDGIISNKSSFNSDSLSEGKHKIFFSVEDNNGNWSDETTADIIVSIPVPLPVIDYFKSQPTQIGLTENSTISWYVTGATVVSIDNGIGIVNKNGKIAVSPGISTKYTLTATNSSGSLISTVDVIVIPEGSFNLPVIKSFAADPGIISPGEKATLSWDVPNASTAKIDPGIGYVEPVGNIEISPDADTSYTITAYNSVGFIIGTTEVIVKKDSGFGKPDLVITDIYKIVVNNSVKIGYTIENRGELASTISNSNLYSNGVYRDIDRIDSIPPGMKLERIFSKYIYSPVDNIIEVIADSDNNISENNESNNALLYKFPVFEVYNFILNAPGAKWSNGYNPVIFGNENEDINGVADYRTNKKLEDATGPDKYLLTQPRFTYGGFINGDYEIDYVVKPGDYFYGIVGLLEGAAAGNVEFQLFIRQKGQSEWEQAGDTVYDIYDYKLQTMVIPIPVKYTGKNIDFRLKVTNVSEPLQNLAVWIQAKLIR